MGESKSNPSRWPEWYTRDPLNIIAVYRTFRVWFPVHVIGCWLLYTIDITNGFAESGSVDSFPFYLGIFLFSAGIILLATLLYTFLITVFIQLVNTYTYCLIPASFAGLLTTILLPLPRVALSLLVIFESRSGISLGLLIFYHLIQIAMNASAIILSWKYLTAACSPQFRFSISSILGGISLVAILCSFMLYSLIVTGYFAVIIAVSYLLAFALDYFFKFRSVASS